MADGSTAQPVIITRAIITVVSLMSGSESSSGRAGAHNSYYYISNLVNFNLLHKGRIIYNNFVNNFPYFDLYPIVNTLQILKYVVHYNKTIIFTIVLYRYGTCLSLKCMNMKSGYLGSGYSSAPIL
jgi:hypothetical protein